MNKYQKMELITAFLKMYPLEPDNATEELSDNMKMTSFTYTKEICSTNVKISYYQSYKNNAEVKLFWLPLRVLNTPDNTSKSKFFDILKIRIAEFEGLKPANISLIYRTGKLK